VRKAQTNAIVTSAVNAVSNIVTTSSGCDLSSHGPSDVLKSLT
jgi:hypothetical protein